MTKAKLARLVNLAVQRADEDGLCNTEDAVAYNDLLMEFQAWEPEAATANGQSAHYWMNLAQQYAEECITLRHRGRG